ncbi:sigma-70 family RNA polymerase sigma factor [Chitinophaga sp.]|jgi:RNA polymerase sigma factor (sigma-70 family)|uniref:RNA polymerase sigma factor n=1 Tax=Chitinophaga sp. TaxID=1869181 RepID=UPI002C286A9A|nr:sigma-70 family RNA polymerase sigma factor [Chitinophaga sp.]HWV69718.1 sigma-70 family RNA polymerase sigma factor [Chitinophaga sp.]
MSTSPYNPQQDEQFLWARLCNGDREAFGEIYRRYFPLLFRYCVRFTTDRALVKDMLQDFFSQLYIQRAGLSLPVNLKSYLMVSARRKLFRYLDKSAHGPSSLEEGTASNFALEVSPESILINRQHTEQTTRLLQQKLDTLTLRQKEAIYLRFYEGLSYEEIADIMALKEVKYARTLIYRAIAELKELLAQNESALMLR